MSPNFAGSLPTPVGGLSQDPRASSEQLRSRREHGRQTAPCMRPCISAVLAQSRCRCSTKGAAQGCRCPPTRAHHCAAAAAAAAATTQRGVRASRIGTRVAVLSRKGARQASLVLGRGPCPCPCPCICPRALPPPPPPTGGARGGGCAPQWARAAAGVTQAVLVLLQQAPCYGPCRRCCLHRRRRQGCCESQKDCHQH